jgi:predicted nucleotidyltransferase
MNKYEEAGNSERLYEGELPLLQEDGFDTKLAGIRLLGRDMARISNPATFRIIKGILDAETEEMGQYKLITDMIRETGISDTRFDEILLQLEKLKQGIVEVGEKNID